MEKTSILILEDDLVFCKLLDTFLSSADYAVTTVQDSISAKELIKSQDYDYILMDYRLPGSNALELICEMFHQTKQAKLILMSRILDENLIFEAQRFGVHHFLKKPFNPKELLLLIQHQHNV
jgi:DNA-binding response OmpR family regulator